MPDSKPAESPGDAEAPAPLAAADAASIDASSTSTTSSDVAPPPSKRVRRDYPWRDVYVRDLGVRPIQFDASSGDAVLVECSFCVHFGREAPPVLAAKPVVKQDGQPIKTRARTRNVAHWKYPFRTDNMRSHHQQQHPHKWKLYQELLEQAKQEHIAAKMQGGGALSDDVSGFSGEAELRLSAFFGDSGEVSSSAASTPSSSAGNLLAVQLPVKRVSRVSSDALAMQNQSATLTAEPRSVSLAVGTIKTPAIVDAVLTAMADVPEHLELSEAGPAPSFFTPELDHVNAMSDNDGTPAQYAVAMPGATTLHRLAPMLRAGLSFSQIARILEATAPSQRLSRGDVTAYARVMVASSLQRISSLLNAAWAYSLHMNVVEPTRSGDPVALCVNVRVPAKQSRSVEEFHVVTLALRPDAESLNETLAFLRKVLSSLDVKWTSKVLSVSLDGATHCLGDRADFVDKQLMPLLDEPKLKAFSGRHVVESCIQAAWTSFLSDSSPFAMTLLELLAVLRSDGEWVQRHGHCPIVKLQNASSVFHALNWLLKHRDDMPQEYSDSVAPSWWWLVACVVIEVWMSCRTAVQGLAANATQEQTLTATEKLRAILKEKCCFTDLEDDEMEEIDHVTTTYDEAERLATLTAAESGNKITIWSDKSMAICFRTLNVSARRLFDELSAKPSATALIMAEREVSRFVLQTVGHISSGLSKHSVINRELRHPPTMPLDFSSIEPAQVVDLIESHSRRLEAAFPTSFLDLAAREIRELQATVATSDAPLVQQLRSSSALASFADAWAHVPQFSAARTIAAGFVTTLPQPQLQQRPAAVRCFSQVENGDLPRFVLADLVVEAHAHAQQAERLDNAVSTSQTTVSSLESQVI